MEWRKPNGYRAGFAVHSKVRSSAAAVRSGFTPSEEPPIPRPGRLPPGAVIRSDGFTPPLPPATNRCVCAPELADGLGGGLNPAPSGVSCACSRRPPSGTAACPNPPAGCCARESSIPAACEGIGIRSAIRKDGTDPDGTPVFCVGSHACRVFNSQSPVRLDGVRPSSQAVSLPDRGMAARGSTALSPSGARLRGMPRRLRCGPDRISSSGRPWCRPRRSGPGPRHARTAAPSRTRPVLRPQPNPALR